MSEIKMPKVQLRGVFSDRNNIDKININMQTNSLDQRTRIAIVNCIFGWVENLDETHSYSYDSQMQDFYRKLMRDVFVMVVDVPLGQLSTSRLFDTLIKSVVLNNSYDEVLTLVEYIIQYFTHTHIVGQQRIYEKEINEVFEREFVGYRFITGFIVPITDEVEIKEIVQSLDIKFKGCKTQIQKALRLLSDREKPDYKNSIKESISAVESICKIIAGNSATLGDALKVKVGKLKKKFLADVFSKGGGITQEDIVFDGDLPCVRYGEIYTKYDMHFESCITRTNLSNVPSPQYFSY
ncbi:MAG: hypothetical protein NC489_43960, partial [Ruminococcus flavefaciens]|nr:hypothetical protein [Ruminococcus flavefaciens]